MPFKFARHLGYPGSIVGAAAIVLARAGVSF